MKKALGADREPFSNEGNDNDDIKRTDKEHRMQTQRSTEPARSTPTSSRSEISAAAAHAAQAKLLLRRAASDIVDPLQVPALLDLVSVLQYLVVSIEQLEATR